VQWVGFHGSTDARERAADIIFAYLTHIAA